MANNPREPADEPSREVRYTPAEMGFHIGDKKGQLNMTGIAVVFLFCGIFAAIVLVWLAFWS